MQKNYELRMNAFHERRGTEKAKKCKQIKHRLVSSGSLTRELITPGMQFSFMIIVLEADTDALIS